MAELFERHLQRPDSDQHVKGADISYVGDTNNLSLELILPLGKRDPHAVTEILEELFPVHAFRKHDTRGRRAGIFRGEEVKAQRLSRGPGGPGQSFVARIHALQPLLLHHFERCMEAEDQRHRRSERRGLLLLVFSLQF